MVAALNKTGCCVSINQTILQRVYLSRETYCPPPAPGTRAGGDSDPNFENYDLPRAQSPGAGRGVHARSWRAAEAGCGMSGDESGGAPTPHVK